MNQQLCLLTYITIAFVSPTDFFFQSKSALNGIKMKRLVFLHFVSKTNEKYLNIRRIFSINDLL